MLAAYAADQIGVALMTNLDAHLHQLGNAGIDGCERVVGKKLLRKVLGHELRLNVIAAEAERRLSEVVGAEAEEVGLGGDFVGGNSSARQLDHSTDGNIKFDAFV